MNDLAIRLFDFVVRSTLFASLLAAFVSVVLLVGGRRLPPAWRYALWLPVLLRLLIPVFPQTPWSIFNAPQWLPFTWETKPKLTVEYFDTPESSAFVPNDPRPGVVSSNSTSRPVMVRPARPWSVKQLLAMIWLCGLTLLLIRLALGSAWLRWRLRQEQGANDAELSEILSAAGSEFGMKGKPRIIETACVESPGLFGCFRPKLLLPRGTFENLSRSELRHVFLHELAHLRRRDLSLNLFMALVQALHWFNPLVWWICRRMRLERELACDALVMERTGPQESRAYGETILKLLEQVASRPRIPLTVGIIEEKTAARSRLAQIASYPCRSRSSARAGIVLFALIAIAGLSNAQTKSVKPAAAFPPTLQVSAEKEEPPGLPTEQEPHSPKPSRLVEIPQGAKDSKTDLAEEGRPLAEVDKADAAEERLEEATRRIRNEERRRQILRERIVLGEGNPWRSYSFADTNNQILTNRTFKNTGRAKIARKLESIILLEWSVPTPTPLSEVIKQLHQAARAADPEGNGVNFITSNESLSAEEVNALIHPVPGSLTGDHVEDFAVLIDPPLSSIRLVDVLDSITKVARPAIGGNASLIYSVEDYAVVFSKGDNRSEALFTRTYKIDPNTLRYSLRSRGQSEDLVTAVRQLFVDAGISYGKDRDPKDNAPPKAVFMNEKTGVLMVRATLRDLDVIEKTLQALNVAPLTVSLETRIIELKPGAAYATDLLLREIMRHHKAPTVGTLSGVLTDPQFKAVIFALQNGQTSSAPLAETESAPAGILTVPQAQEILASLGKAQGVTVLAAPKITTISQRQARISIEPGPMLDIIPSVREDGTSIKLTVLVQIPPDAKRKFPAINASAKRVLWDGQTLVLLNADARRTVIVFVTPTLIDAKGYRVHEPQADDETIPAQEMD